MIRRLVVLGSSGYVGEAVCADAERRRPPVAAVVRVRECSEVLRRVPDLGPGDVVLNCAGYYGSDRDRLWDANVRHVRDVAAMARETGSGIVHLSSSAVFDGIRAGRISEVTTPRPISPYACSKLAGEQALRALVPEALIARPAKVFGGHDPRGRLHSLLRHVLSGRPLPMPERPRLWANFVWLHELAGVLVSEALEPGPRGLFHVASPLPWLDFTVYLGEAAGVPVRRAPRALESAAAVAMPLVERARPLRRVRGVERLVELWDRRWFVDSDRRIEPASVLAGLREVAEQVAG